jgi:hypothetical protein
MHGQMRNAFYNILAGNYPGNRPNEKPSRKRHYNIKMDLQKQDVNVWNTFENEVTNLQV